MAPRDKLGGRPGPAERKKLRKQNRQIEQRLLKEANDELSKKKKPYASKAETVTSQKSEKISNPDFLPIKKLHEPPKEEKEKLPTVKKEDLSQDPLERRQFFQSRNLRPTSILK